MRIVICTGNGIRHRYVANILAHSADDALIIAECRPSEEKVDPSQSLGDYYRAERLTVERQLFLNNAEFQAKTLQVKPGEINLPAITETVERYQPDAVFVFGASIIKKQLMSVIPRGRTVNLHLGLSPYYRGAATNFWPFINDELQFVGSTILHLDPGVDTGDIICHTRPPLQANDTVHTAGCRVIRESTATLLRIMDALRRGETLPRNPQWASEPSRYYRIRDLDEPALQRYRDNMLRGIVQRYVENPSPTPRLIELP